MKVLINGVAPCGGYGGLLILLMVRIRSPIVAIEVVYYVTEYGRIIITSEK